MRFVYKAVAVAVLLLIAVDVHGLTEPTPFPAFPPITPMPFPPSVLLYLRLPDTPTLLADAFLERL